MCVDDKKLNAVTVKDQYYLSFTKDQRLRIKMLGGSGFYQVSTTKNFPEKTAFVTTNLYFKFSQLPFRLFDASVVLQRENGQNKNVKPFKVL